MFPVACVFNDWASQCRYCDGSGWVLLATIRGEGK